MPTSISGGGVAVKGLSAAVFAGCVVFGTPAFAQNADYIKAPERINNTLITDNVNKVVFENFTSEDFNAAGGAIYNTKSHADVNIVADFNNNAVSAFESDMARAEGGAIHNGAFTQGYAAEMLPQSLSSGTQISGLNKAEAPILGNITGNFSNNSATAVHDALGGAIFNEGKIENIKGNFTANNAQAAYAQGGAIANVYYANAQANQNSQGVLGLLSLDYETDVDDEPTSKMVIPHDITISQIKSIDGKFLNNYIIGSETAQGGAIYNSAVIREIKGTYSKNNVKGKNSYGGAIYNTAGTQKQGVLDLLGSVSDEDYGIEPMIKVEHNISVIPTAGVISDIQGDFIGNTVFGLENAGGGVVYNSGAITNLSGLYKDNKVEGKAAVGGAIANCGSVSTGGNFSLLSSVMDVQPNLANINANRAVSGQISNITADFIANSVQGETSALGGAIYNTSVIGVLVQTTDNVEENLTSAGSQVRDPEMAEDMLAQANNQSQGVLGLLCSDNADDMYNTTTTAKSAEKPSSGYKIDRAGDDPAGLATSEKLQGNVIEGGIVNSSFIGNSAVSKDGVALGGAIYTTTSLNIIAKDGYTVVFKNNYTESAGKRDDNAIYVGKTLVQNNQSNQAVLPLLGSVDAESMYNTTSTAKSAEKLSNGYKVNRSGTDTVTLTLKMENGGKILMADNIDGDLGATTQDKDSIKDADMAEDMAEDTNQNILDTASTDGLSSGYKINRVPAEDSEQRTKTEAAYGYKVNIEGDDINNTTFYMLNDIRNAAVTISNTTINTINNQTHVYDFGALRIGADTKMFVDVDLQNKAMDRFTSKSAYAQTVENVSFSKETILQQTGQSMLTTTNVDTNNSADNATGLAISESMREQIPGLSKAESQTVATASTIHNGNLIVTGMNLMSDAKTDKTEILFAQKDLKDNVKSEVTVVYSPIYSYSVKYDNREDGGYFQFIRGGANGSGVAGFNPAIVASPVAAQAGATATMNQTFNYAFQNADNFMVIPYLERVAMKNKNKYALSPTGDATDMGTYSPLFTKNDNASTWVKPYASFENIPLKNGPKVSNITYGTLVGFDSDMASLKNGWDRVWTGYIGYNGASQRYSGVDSTQNGGLLGGTLTLYKGNFFNATTISAGANVANNKTMYGSEDFTMLLAGIGNKTGYNFELKEGRIIIQPSMLLSYTFVNTFDYTNAAGVKINSKPLNALQLAPGLKIIGNTKTGWQPYIGVNMVWNLLDKSDVTANNVKLPEMSIKPYVQYGVGVQKRFKDRCMAFGQAMLQSGGRNGISLTAGFRWALGKDTTEKVQRVNDKRVTLNGRENPLLGRGQGEGSTESTRKVIKQLTPKQRTSLGRLQNTTRTTSTAVLKQL